MKKWIMSLFLVSMLVLAACGGVDEEPAPEEDVEMEDPEDDLDVEDSEDDMDM
ncbi:type 2 periplasmic-binding domain-containing protein [Alkalibacillus aidingensis]|uniref:hypothetical protein n=1 Tax=Alkalibacillus aidingensis TaxID=2747607 RepID=UPI001661872C|nr:hypothetical protein [Alkalibacillus aidingensis]